MNTSSSNNFLKLQGRADLPRWQAAIVLIIREKYPAASDLIHFDDTPPTAAEVQRRFNVAAENMEEVSTAVPALPEPPPAGATPQVILKFINDSKVNNILKMRRDGARNASIAVINFLISNVTDPPLAKIRTHANYSLALSSCNLAAFWKIMEVGLEEAGGQRFIVANKAAALLFNCKQKEGEDIAEYVHRFSQVRMESRRCGNRDMGEQPLAYLFVDSLAKYLTPCRNAIVNQNPPIATFADAASSYGDYMEYNTNGHFTSTFSTSTTTTTNCLSCITYNQE
jgi:hypothetical protein